MRATMLEEEDCGLDVTTDCYDRQGVNTRENGRAARVQNSRRCGLKDSERYGRTGGDVRANVKVRSEWTYCELW